MTDDMDESDSTYSGYCRAETDDGLVCARAAGHGGQHGSLEDGEIVWWSE